MDYWFNTWFNTCELRVSLPPALGERIDILFTCPNPRAMRKVVGLDPRFLLSSSSTYDYDHDGHGAEVNDERSEGSLGSGSTSPDLVVAECSDEEADGLDIVPLYLDRPFKIKGRYSIASGLPSEGGAGDVDGLNGKSPASSSSGTASYEKEKDSPNSSEDSQSEEGPEARERTMKDTFDMLEGRIPSKMTDVQSERATALAKLEGIKGLQNREYSEYPPEMCQVFEHFQKQGMAAAKGSRLLESMLRGMMTESSRDGGSSSSSNADFSDQQDQQTKARPARGSEILRAQLKRRTPLKDRWQFVTWDDSKQVLLLHLEQKRYRATREQGVTRVRNLNTCSEEQYVEEMKMAAERDWEVMVLVCDEEDEYPLRVPMLDPESADPIFMLIR